MCNFTWREITLRRRAILLTQRSRSCAVGAAKSSVLSAVATLKHKFSGCEVPSKREEETTEEGSDTTSEVTEGEEGEAEEAVGEEEETAAAAELDESFAVLVNAFVDLPT